MNTKSHKSADLYIGYVGYFILVMKMELMNRKIRPSIYIVLIALFAAIPVGIRIAFIMTGLSVIVQWTNIIGVFTFIGAIFLGPVAGIFIGFTGFLLSDVISPWGVSPYTILMGGTMAAIGFISGLTISYEDEMLFFEKVILIVKLYILMFIYDAITSIVGYLLWGLTLNDAIFYGIVGLFIPLYGGYLWLVGPITEATTSIITTILLDPIRRVFRETGVY